MPGLTLLRASRIPPSFIRASSFRDPFPRERFVIVYRIVYPIHGILAHPPHPFETAEDLDAPKASRAWGASLSASKFMNRRRLLLLPSNPAIRTINASVPRLNFALEAWKMSPSYSPPFVNLEPEIQTIEKVYDPWTLWATTHLRMDRLIDFDRERLFERANIFRNLVDFEKFVRAIRWKLLVFSM